MSAENLLAHIDFVSHPRDRDVHIARTDEVIGVGIISVPRYNKALLVEIDPVFSSLNLGSFKSLLTGLGVYVLNDTSEAVVGAMGILQAWFNEHSPEPRVLTPDMFTAVVKDAPLNKPHMGELGGGVLSKAELHVREQKLARIQGAGMVIPLNNIINPLKNSLKGR